MDKFYLESTLLALNPSQFQDLKYLGVDEVARAKGQDYMTVIYDGIGAFNSLRTHREGICNFVKHRLTSARIEAGNISIGMV